MLNFMSKIMPFYNFKYLCWKSRVWQKENARFPERHFTFSCYARKLQLLCSPPPTPGGGSADGGSGLAHHTSPAGTPYHSGSQSVRQATLGHGSLSQADLTNTPPFHIIHRTKIGTIAHISKAVKNNCGRSLAQVLNRVANGPNFFFITPFYTMKPHCDFYCKNPNHTLMSVWFQSKPHAHSIWVCKKWVNSPQPQ